MSLIPKAIELAFAVHADRTLPSGRPRVEHSLRVWEKFRHFRPLGETPLRRYEELACVALLYDVLADGLIDEQRLAAEFGSFVAGSVGRVGGTDLPSAADDPDIRMIMLLARLDHLAAFASALSAETLTRRLTLLERQCLPLVSLHSPEFARAFAFELDDVRREGRLGLSPLTT